MTPELKAAYDRRYRAEHLAERAAYHRAWQRTPLGRVRNKLYVVRHRLRLRPTDTLRETAAMLEAEIERLREAREGTQEPPGAIAGGGVDSRDVLGSPTR